MLRAVLLTGLCSALCLFPAGLRAQSPVYAFTWEAPEGCPTQTEVQAQLEHEVDFAAHPPGALSLRGRVRQERDGYRLQLATDLAGRVGQRELHAVACEDLARAVTLVAALLMGRKEVPPEPSAPPEPAPASAPVPIEELPAQGRAPASPSPVALWLAGGVQLQLLPHTAGLAALGVDVAWPMLTLRAEGGVLPQVTEQESTDLRGSYAGAFLAASGCYAADLVQRVRGDVCLGLSAAALRGQSYGALVSSRAVIAPYYAARTGLAVTWPQGSWIALRISAGLLVSLNRPEFTVEGFRRVHRVPRFAPLGTLAVVFAPF